ncbi:MAG TPA: hypothetical protein VMI56_06810 [Reyranella sp.]|nr:hypothetical protein [Reyranella sp.]
MFQVVGCVLALAAILLIVLNVPELAFVLASSTVIWVAFATPRQVPLRPVKYRDVPFGRVDTLR